MTEPIAIIGMAGRFPKAKTVDAFWEVLRDGVEVIERVPDELIDSRRDSRGQLPPEFVPMGVYLEDTEYFDCGLFGVSQRDAKIMDPQQRLFLEQAWAAAEDAGYDISKLGERVAVYAGAGPSRHPLDAMEVFGHDSATTFEIIATGIDKPMAMRASHLFNLTGESIYVYAACATSLVAIDMAFRALRDGRADAAIAGASVLYLPQMEGYDYAEGGVRSSDGHCRAFDARADGTVWGSGVGVVVLKGLSRALRDHDRIRAIIIGSAVNNDGGAKASFAAPSEAGQVDVIRFALDKSGVTPEEVGYVEAHGTGTVVGDPIEIAALNSAFGRGSGVGSVPIGSVKTNIGHLDPAAGVAGLIKTVLALEHEAIPPTLHFERPNPAIDFDGGPFFVNADLRPWPRSERPRIAGISSFGVGGTNAHVIVQEAPSVSSRAATSREFHLVTLSARSFSALETMRRELATHMEGHPDTELRDVAFTRNAGRREFPVRLSLVCDTTDSLVSSLRDPGQAAIDLRKGTRGADGVAFVFPGQGSHSIGMAADIYAAESQFRQDVDDCAEILKVELGLDVRDLIYPGRRGLDMGAERLRHTDVQQPILFAISFSLARLLESWGCEPVMMIGHSVGEYVAAALAGTLSPVEALKLLVARGRAMRLAGPGAMLAVALSPEELEQILPRELDLAAVNAPASVVVAGPGEVVASFEAFLSGQRIRTVRLDTACAFHSRMMEPARAAFEEALAEVTLHPPKRGWVSSLTGQVVTSGQARDPEYWVRQLREPVRFRDGVDTILAEGIGTFVELGGRPTLGGPILQCAIEAERADVAVFSATPRAREKDSGRGTYLKTVGELWRRGVRIDWQAFHCEDEARRIGLPHYPFEGDWVALYPQDRAPGEARTIPRRRAADGSDPAGFLARGLHAAAPQAQRAPRPLSCPQPPTAPADEIEGEVAEIFSRILGIAPIGVQDSLFDLGGTSIMLVHIANQLRAVFQLNVTIREITDNDEPRSLAQLVRERLKETAGTSPAAQRKGTA